MYVDNLVVSPAIATEMSALVVLPLLDHSSLHSVLAAHAISILLVCSRTGGTQLVTTIPLCIRLHELLWLPITANVDYQGPMGLSYSEDDPNHP